LQTVNFQEEDFKAFKLTCGTTKDSNIVTFEYKQDTWSLQSLKNENNKAREAHNALYYNIVWPKLLPW